MLRRVLRTKLGLATLGLILIIKIAASPITAAPSDNECDNLVAAYSKFKRALHQSKDGSDSEWVHAFARLLHARKIYNASKAHHRDPHLTTALRVAADQFISRGDSALNHIIEGDWSHSTNKVADAKLSGGLHYASTYFRVIHDLLVELETAPALIEKEQSRTAVDYLLRNTDWVRLKGKKKQAREQFKTQMAEALVNGSDLAVDSHDPDAVVLRNILSTIVEDFKAYGLDILNPRDRVAYEAKRLLLNGSPRVDANGVIKTTFSPLFIRPKTWRVQMVEATLNGAAPLGAKTFFPATWNEAKIKEAIVSILRGPDQRVLRVIKDSANSVKFALVEGVIQNVHIRIALFRNQVVSAYPSWIQKVMTFEELQSELEISTMKVARALTEIADATGLPKINIFQARRLHLGLSTYGLTPKEQEDWRLFLDPTAQVSFKASIESNSRFIQALSLYGQREILQKHLGETFVIESTLGLPSKQITDSAENDPRDDP